jgi:hypothetical protein
MSVELHAPKGNEVQYLALWIGLLSELAAPGQASVRVEEKEDAEVSLAIGTSAVRIAVQSKYQQGAGFPGMIDSVGRFECISPVIVCDRKGKLKLPRTVTSLLMIRPFQTQGTWLYV